MKHIKSISIILLGNLLLSFGISAFLLPMGFVSGGATGMGIIVKHYTGIPISYSVLVFNVFFFAIGFRVLGKKFVATTLLSTLFYPLCLNILERFSFSALNEDTLLSALYAGLLSGIGLGLVFKEGASTGGTDIPVLLLNRKKGLPLEAGLYIVDGIVILGQAAFTRPMNILYGLVIMILSSFVIGRIELMGNTQFQIFVISPRYREVQTALLHHMDTGVTLVQIETGLRKIPSLAVLTVIPRRKLTETTQLIQLVDEEAFITVHEIREVRGRGYSLKREYVETE